MPKTNTIEIDGARLRREFEIRNVALIDASKKCGFEESYFSKVCRMNKITKPASNLLQQMFNIRYEDYKIDNVVEEQEVKEVKEVPSITITEEISHELYGIIYSAVYDAVKKVWSE